MSISASIRRFALALTLALSLGMFVAALLGPSQTLAKAHVSTCSSTHPKPKCNSHACSHKGRAHHASKCTGKHSKKNVKPPVILEEEPGGSGETECEEGPGSCSAGTVPGPTAGSAAGTKVCEGSASEGSSALCEEEG